MKNRNMDLIPSNLRSLEQWVNWDKDAKKTQQPSKAPRDPKTGLNAKVNDPATWGSFKQAVSAKDKFGLAGVGFVLTKDDDLVAIDLDHCRDPDSREIEKWAKDIVDELASYTEISPSGTGLHIWGRGQLPPGGRKKGNIEMYDRDRYLTVTGQHLEGTPKKILRKPNALKRVHSKVFGEPPAPPQQPVLLHRVLGNDEEIIARAMQAKNGAKFRALWKGDFSAYPSRSEADLALCSLLTFWAAGDATKADWLFRTSGLMRPKWDEVHSADGRTYGQGVIEKALSGRITGYAGPTLDEAKAVVEGLVEQTKTQPTATLKDALKNQDILNAMATVARMDKGCYEVTCMSLKEAGLSVREIDSLKKVVNAQKRSEHLRVVNPGEGVPVVKVQDVLPDAPVTPDTTVPQGWVLDEMGVRKERMAKDGQRGFMKWFEEASPLPVIIQAKAKNIDNHTEALRLAWLDDGEWRKLITGRGTIADARLIVGLADRGFPVTSGTARLLVEYLAAFEIANRDLPSTKTTSHLGWVGSTKKPGFLLGRTIILPDGDVIRGATIDGLSPDTWPKGLAFFEAPDSGGHQLASAFKTKGEMDKWLKALYLVRGNPLANFAVLASLTAPLLEILKAPNIIVDFSFTTSTGKTTALKMAASVWGNPDDRSPNPLLRSWDSTRVWIERAAALHCNLPLILDDTKRARAPKMVTQLLYDNAQGQSRGRGSTTGTTESGTWRSVLLSSGESKATNFTAGAGGAHARVISIWGAPFGKSSEDKAKLINRMTDLIEANYGHAGLRFVQHLILNRFAWPSWRRQYKKLTMLYSAMAKGNSVRLRQAKMFAAIHLAGQIAKGILDLPFLVPVVLRKAYQIAAREVHEADIAKNALRQVYSWAVGNQNRFWGQQDSNKPAFIDRLGAWPKYTEPDGDFSQPHEEGKKSTKALDIAFLSHQLYLFLL